MSDTRVNVIAVGALIFCVFLSYVFALAGEPRAAWWWCMLGGLC